VSLHLWRRSHEYYFIDLLAELNRYRQKIDYLAVTSSHRNYYQQEFKKEETEQERWSLNNPPR
ncbi:unnamed protein product, partial [Rotaria magnacalcarata]